jgi:hypothetical protein
MGPSGKPGYEAIEIKLLAAVFADGTSEGEPEWISRIVNQRRKTFADLKQALAILREEMAKETPREALLGKFHEFRSRNLAAVTGQQSTSFEHSAADRVPSTVLLNLEKKLLPNQTTTEVQEALGSTIEFLEQWHRELASSKPDP